MVVMIQYLFGILPQFLYGQLLFGQIIIQSNPNDYICLFYISKKITEVYQYCSIYQMMLNVYILKSIILYTKYNNHYIYNIVEKYIDLYQIICKYIGNKIVEILSSNLWLYN